MIYVSPSHKYGKSNAIQRGIACYRSIHCKATYILINNKSLCFHNVYYLCFLNLKSSNLLKLKVNLNIWLSWHGKNKNKKLHPNPWKQNLIVSVQSHFVSGEQWGKRKKRVSEWKGQRHTCVRGADLYTILFHIRVTAGDGRLPVERETFYT